MNPRLSFKDFKTKRYHLSPQANASVIKAAPANNGHGDSHDKDLRKKESSGDAFPDFRVTVQQDAVSTCRDQYKEPQIVKIQHYPRHPTHSLWICFLFTEKHTYSRSIKETHPIFT